MSRIIQLKNIVSEKINEKVSAKKMIQEEEFGIVRLFILPGGKIEPHIMPMKVYFQIIKGSGVFTYDGKPNLVGVGDLIEASQGKERGWDNTGTEEMEIIVVKRKV